MKTVHAIKVVFLEGLFGKKKNLKGKGIFHARMLWNAKNMAHR